MNCEIKNDKYCYYMTSKGCSYNECHPIIEKCNECDKIYFSKIKNMSYCTSYADPELKWKHGDCNFATHTKEEVKEEKKMNALKASKRKAKGKVT